MSQRIEYLDIAKGLGIFCIVIGHNTVPQGIYDWIYSFHVPLFFIISGYFYRQRPIAETLAKIWRQLLLPMLITIMVTQASLAILFLRHGSWQGPSLEQWISEILLFRNPGSGMWFFMALAWGKIFLCLLHKMGERILPIAVVVLFLLGYYLRNEIHEAPWSLVRALFVPFYLYVGMLLNKYSVLNRLNSPLVLLIAILTISFAWLCPINMHGAYYPLGLLNVLTVCLISLSILIVLKRASELSELPKRLFRFAGLNSLFILCLHSWVHTFQLDRIFWESLPPIENVHFVLGLGVVPVAECLLLVVSVYLLNRVTWVNDLFHGK